MELAKRVIKSTLYLILMIPLSILAYLLMGLSDILNKLLKIVRKLIKED